MSFPLQGGQKTTFLWLGDAYTTLTAQAVGSADTTIYLTQTDELQATGVITIGLEQIAYTGVTPAPTPSITGCTRGYNSTTAAAYLVGTTVYPQVTYTGTGNITILVGGMPAGPTLLSLALPGGVFGPAGVPLILPLNTIQSGITGAVQISLQETLPAGLEQQYTNLSITTTPVTRPGDETTGFVSIISQPVGLLYVQQRDQGLVQRMRLLPINQQVQSNLPGFTWGQYRWRDNTTENAQTVVPSVWDVNTNLIQQDFIGGVGSIGETDDLEPIDLEERESSIYLRASRGQYFTGTKRYYLPSDNFNLEFLSCYPGLPFTYQLLKPPREQTPVFVGTWGLDSQGFYEYSLNARYTIPSTFNSLSSQPQFMVDRKTGILTVNASVQIPQTTIILGILSGGQTEYFDMPIYPLDKIVYLYVGNPTVVIPTYTFDRENGNVTFNKVPGTSPGQPLFAVVDAAIAVLYEYDVDDNTEIQNTNIPDAVDLLKDTRLLTPDLNPAFSGLASGYVYLQHRILKPVAVTLSADKPQIPIPATLSSIINLIAYGPIFYNGDHALLTATAIGSLPGEVIPGAQLQVIPGGLNPLTGLPLQSYPFRGLINGLDPNTNTITVITGGDGAANLVYQPEPDFGFYIPTSSPWVTASMSYAVLGGAQAPTWISGVATISLTTPLSDRFVQGTGIRLAGFTSGGANNWNGDYAIALVSSTQPFALTGSASIVVNTGTVQFTQIPTRVINVGDQITISKATSPALNGTFTVATASLVLNTWTVTFNTTNTPFVSTPQTAGTITDNSQIILNIPTDPGIVSVEGTAGSLDTLLLPNPIPISQIWAGPPNNEGWLEFLYAVLSNDGLFGLSYPLTGSASVTSGVGTIQAVQSLNGIIVPGNTITIAQATSSAIDGSWPVLTAVLSGGIWTITFTTSAGDFGSTPQTQGSLSIGSISFPFLTNGTVNGDVTITNAAWTGNIATFTLASAPTGLEQGQNVDIVGCTTGTLNGVQNVLSVYETLGTWYITTPTATAGTSSEAEASASFNYSNFRSNGVLSVWTKSISPWIPNRVYQIGDTALDLNNNIEQVITISGTGTSGSSVPVWNTAFGGETIDNGGANQIVWAQYGKQGSSSSIPIHAYDKNGVDYNEGIFTLTGNAQIVTGIPNVATVQVVQIPSGVISPGDNFTISGATSSSLNGAWTVATAGLVGSTWTITFNTTAAVFPSTPQVAGTLTDTTFLGNVVKLVFNTGLVNPSQGFLQAYLFQFLEREIIQMQVVGTTILSNSIMLEMETPEQILANPYLVLSTDQTVTPYYANASETSRFNINRLGITPSVAGNP